ncbi:MAG: hypothetical protein NVS1B11_34900 [Terriglobales bacterium]
MLNVCSPSPEEKQELSSALARIPASPSFAPDFEVDRGRSTLGEAPEFLKSADNSTISPDSGVAIWVRVRREFPPSTMFSTVQYSFSVDPQNMVETLAFRVRDPKELMQVSIEDTASAVTTPAAMLEADTPATRIKLERFGKSSVVLARCPGTPQGPPPDQSAYDPIFRNASAIVSNYRRLLNARETVPGELAHTRSTANGKMKATPHKTKIAPTKPSVTTDK